ncbi:MAG: tetratricopeptide repeat protein [Bacteroidota bacterium]
MRVFCRFFGLILAMVAACPPARAQAEMPRSAMACYELGETHAQSKDWDAALAAFNAALQRDAYFADAYYARGLVREQTGLLNEALTDYNIYVSLRPEHVEARFNRAQLRFRLEQYALALEDFKMLLYLPAGETTTVFFRQNAFGGEVNQVFTAQGANNSYLHNYIGLALTQLQRLDEAVAAFDSALLKTPDADVLVNRGIAYEKMGKIDLARLDYEAALQRQPHHALAKHNLALLSARTRPEETNVQLLDEAINDNPALPYAWAERGHARFLQGNYEGALSDFSEAIRINPAEAGYYLQRGQVYEKLHRPTDAYTDYTQAVKLDERDEKAWLHRGNLLTRLGRWQEAVEDYTVALTHHPSYASAWYNRALARQRLGQLVHACADLAMAEQNGLAVPAKLKKQVCKE